MTNLVVSISDGQLRGQTKKDDDGNTFCSFEGVPYGKAPVGELRFKAPQPVEPWMGIKDAITKGPFSYCLRPEKLLSRNPAFSKNNLLSLASGKEDCLNLNVYTRQLPQNDVFNLKPVMVWVHAGAFVLGDTTMHGPEFLIREDVVIVSIHYRLGALGFLVLEDAETEVPGNAAMKDMVLALQWVQKNIKNFNGDPNNVTVFGESAGGAAVHYFILSPLCKGLFHKAIIQSGSALNCWATGDRQNGKKLAKVLGCKSNNDKEILKFLQSLSLNKLFAGQLQLPDAFDASLLRPFAPVVEVNSKSPFLSKQPLDVIKSGDYNQVPMISGFNSQEGLWFMVFDVPGFRPRAFGEKTMIPHFYGVKHGTEESSKLIKEISKFYYGNEVPSKSPISRGTISLATDNLFVREICLHSQLHSATSKLPVYLYRLSMKSEMGLIPLPPKRDGVTHGEDVEFLFKNVMTPKVQPGSGQDITRRRLTRLWANFAKTGNPNSPTGSDELISEIWKPVTKNEINYLDIGKDLVSAKNPEDDRMKFWKDLTQKYFGNKFNV